MKTENLKPTIQESFIILLFNHKLKIEVEGSESEHSINDLVNIAAGSVKNEIVSPEAANERLEKFGIKIAEKTFYISPVSLYIREVLDAEPEFKFYANSYSRLLARFEGAKTLISRMNGKIVRVYQMPVDVVNEIYNKYLPL